MYFGFKNVTVRYGRKTVLENVSVDIPKGKIVTLIGQNGCGKSSLLKIVSRAVEPRCGGAMLDGRPLRQYPPKLLARKIAYLAQVHTSPPDIDVRTLVSYGRYPYTRLGRGLTEADGTVIERVLAMTGLKELESRILSTLSGGERQRAWIAMAICQEPEILILDEPTTYLDIGYQIEVLELIKKLNAELGITIVMVLHDLNLAARYSDMLYAIKNRRVYACGSCSDIITECHLKNIFDIEATVFEDKINACPYFIPLKTITQNGD